MAADLRLGLPQPPLLPVAGIRCHKFRGGPTGRQEGSTGKSSLVGVCRSAPGLRRTGGSLARQKGRQGALNRQDAEVGVEGPPSGPEQRETGKETDNAVVGRSSSDVEGKDDLWAYRQGMAWTLLIFMAPALTIPLADPLMSLVDTVVVGQCCGTLELAALGPPNLIFAFANYMWTSQGVTTTSLVADAFNQEGVTRQQAAETAERAMSSSAIISVAAGVAVCGALQVFGPALVALTGAAPELAATGLEYLRIRALATPAVFGSIVIQAALMAQRNSLWPSLVVAASVLVNVGLDLALIAGCGMGPAGAAWATVGSQYAALFLLVAVTRRGEGALRLRWMFPCLEDLKGSGNTSSSLAFIYFCKLLCYFAIQRTATGLPLVSLAAHQPVFMLWNLCSHASSPLEQAALAFLPGARSEAEKRELPRVLLAMGAAIGLASGLVSFGIPAFLPSFFTPDCVLHPLIRAVAPQAFLSILLAGLEVGATGVLISRRDYGFVKDAMLRTLAVTAAAIAAVNFCGWGLQGVWWTLVLFFGFRALQSLPRSMVSRRRAVAA